MDILTHFRKIRYQVLYHLIVNQREKSNSKYADQRQSLLIGKSFTILSNNCWGGHVYRYFSLPYLTPTIGLYFYPDDYLKFIGDYKKYLAAELTFIPWQESKHADSLRERNQTNVPIGKLDDVEIVFLHYKSESEAYEKWNRRVARINWDHILVKCSKQNGMTDEQVEQYDKLPINNKIIFVDKPMPNVKSAVLYYKKRDIIDGQVCDDIICFNKYVDLAKWINSSFKGSN